MKYLIVIPARMASSRLPGKPLIDILGKSLIQRTYEQCLKAVSEEKVVVATDHEDIASHCRERSINFIITSSECLTGTDRVAEVAKKLEADCYINVQGDEPLIDPQDILKVIEKANEFPSDIINGYAPILDASQYISLTIPKVVFRPDGRLLYMSRSPIPGNKTAEFKQSWRQICIYSFPKEALASFAARGKKSPLEENEDIEILRFLEMGYEVRMIGLSNNSVAVDTPDDLHKVINMIKQKNLSK